MADLLQNKPSILLNVISTSLLQLLLMLIIFNYFYTPEVTTHEGSQVVLIELSQTVTNTEIEIVKDRLEDLSIKHIDFISKEQAWKALTSTMKSDLSEENPLKDLLSVEVSSHPDFITELESSVSDLGYVDGIFGAEVSPANCSRPHLPQSLKLVPSLLILILATILYFKYLFRVINRNNGPLIKSMQLYGSDTSEVYDRIKKSVLSTSFKGWLLGIFLFLVVVYLIYGSFGVNNGDISTIEFVITILAPLLITWIVASFMARSASNIKY